MNNSSRPPPPKNGVCTKRAFGQRARADWGGVENDRFLDDFLGGGESDEFEFGGNQFKISNLYEIPAENDVRFSCSAGSDTG